jgi:hypothetical protein
MAINTKVAFGNGGRDRDTPCGTPWQMRKDPCSKRLRAVSWLMSIRTLCAGQSGEEQEQEEEQGDDR